jgi:hypothetical protein
MKRKAILASLVLAAAFAVPAFSQEAASLATEPSMEKLKAAAAAAEPKIETNVDYRLSLLKLDDPAKEARLKALMLKHLTAVYEWHKDHGAKFDQLVPAGLNIGTGKKLNNFERMYIADSAIPASVHKELMDGLKKDLTQEQIWVVMDDYTEPGHNPGKIKFTFDGYRSIIAMDKQRPQLTADEETEIMKNLREAGELSMDLPTRGTGITKNGLVSQVFEVYKTKNEAYLNAHGRDWHALFGAYANRNKPANPASSTTPATKPAD